MIKGAMTLRLLFINKPIIDKYVEVMQE